MGKVTDADALLRRFTRNNLQHPTYQGLHELGRVIKTIFLCEFLSDQRLRQEIQEALNVIEQWKNAMKQEDWRGLTPLFYQHVNPNGRFTLDMTQRLPLSLTKIA